MDAATLEVAPALVEGGLGGLQEDAHQLVLPQILEQHDGIEAGEELRAHAVVEEVLVAQPVPQVEDELLSHLAALDDGDRLKGSPVPADGDPVENGVVEPFERPGADEQEV